MGITVRGTVPTTISGDHDGTGNWTFDNPVTAADAPTLAAHLANKTYVDANGFDPSDDQTITGTWSFDDFLTLNSYLIVNGSVVQAPLHTTQDADGGFLAQNLGADTKKWLKSRVSGDGNERFQVQADGKMLWGDGASPADTDLLRSGAGALKTTGNFRADGSIQASSFDDISGSGYTSTGGGKIRFENGAASTDNFFRCALATDAVRRFTSDYAGKLQWGPGGVGALDTNQYRSGVAELKTDGSYVIGTNLTVNGNTVLGNAVTDTVGLYGDTGAAQAAAIADASGGVVVDAEARTAINALLAAARTSTGIAMIAG